MHYISGGQCCANHCTALLPALGVMLLHLNLHKLTSKLPVPHSLVCVSVYVCANVYAHTHMQAHVLCKGICFWAPSSPLSASPRCPEGGKRPRGAHANTESRPSAQSPASRCLRALQCQALAPGKVTEAEIGCPPSPRENKNILIKAGKALGTIALAPG